MGKKLIVAVALVAILTVAAAASFACEGSYNKSKAHYEKSKCEVVKKGHMILKNQDELGLSVEQAKKIKDLVLKSKKDAIMQDAEIKTITLDIKSKKWEDTVDIEAINVLIDKKYELKKTKAKSSIAAVTKLKSILTEKQRDKLKELYKQCKTKDFKGTIPK